MITQEFSRFKRSERFDLLVLGLIDIIGNLFCAIISLNEERKKVIRGKKYNLKIFRKVLKKIHIHNKKTILSKKFFIIYYFLLFINFNKRYTLEHGTSSFNFYFFTT
jgi:hypothetical protein